MTSHRPAARQLALALALVLGSCAAPTDGDAVRSAPSVPTAALDGGGTAPAADPSVELGGDGERDRVRIGTPSPRPAPPVVGLGVVDVDAPEELASALTAPVERPTTVRRGDADVERAVRLASLLARDVGRRPAGSRGDAVARATVTAWLREAGWDVTEQPVPLPQGGGTANLVATIGGRGPELPHVVVGAHLDTVVDSPGANDNASGVGALVALAEELADEAVDGAVPVVLVAFGAEEYQPVTPRVHHLGSDVYAAAHAGEVLGMLSIDMVANGADTCICWLSLGPRTLATRLAALAPDRGYRVRSVGDVSDHGPFARRGVPAAFLWTGMDAAWHSPRDTPANVDGDDLARSLRLALAFLRSLDEADLDGLRAELPTGTGTGAGTGTGTGAGTGAGVSP